ncbi:uncharacterized protein LOC118782897 [Megalops cyprinoides]|uniref:uncharacterized protein LOC118782897 n=1 Tax=Megalops cyprinoides TaxID=118141 RepID=UPI001864AF9F|nr:uncharacterized protein LOC118782897 [Megalops cyprinoides]
MNLFCFSLEGSMDSLYEAVQDADEGQVYTIPSRSCSPAVMLDENAKWRGSERSISLELSQIHTTNAKKKKRKPLIPKSMSDNEALDNAECINTYWPSSKKREDLVHLRNNQNGELGMELLQAGFQMGDCGLRQLNNQREKEQATQVMSYDTWIPNWERPNSRQQDPAEKRPNTPQRAQENSAPGPIPTDRGWAMGVPPNRQRWSTSGEPPPPWGGPYHTCRRPLSEFRAYTCDLTLPRPDSLAREPSPHCVARSITNADLCVSSTRFLQ